jgi:hypothetical protein
LRVHHRILSGTEALILTLLKACTVIGLTLLGVVLTNWKRFEEHDPVGVGSGFALLICALMAFLFWFRGGSNADDR